jgi:hypothetical protein
MGENITAPNIGGGDSETQAKKLDIGLSEGDGNIIEGKVEMAAGENVPDTADALKELEKVNIKMRTSQGNNNKIIGDVVMKGLSFNKK